MIGYGDESALYLLPCVGYTWARKGQTPILRDGDRYAHLSVISVMTETGDLYYQIQTTSYDGEGIVRFLNVLREAQQTRLTVIWDGRRFIGGRPSQPFYGRRTMGRFNWNDDPRTVQNSMRMNRSGRMSKSRN